VFQGFLYYKRKVGTFCAIAVIVFALVFMLFNSIGKHLFCLFDLHADLGQVSKLHGRAILGNERFQIEPVKMKVTVFYIEPFLGKVKGLFHQVGVRVVHVLVQVADSREF
jgi:hypothetical protein